MCYYKSVDTWSFKFADHGRCETWESEESDCVSKGKCGEGQ